MSTANTKMAKARANLIMAQPFFGSLALRLKMEETTEIAHGDTDGQTIRYNPDWVAKAPLSKVTGMVAHLVMHPAMLHHTRRGARDKKRWNQACDHAINSILTDAGFDLPEGKYNDPQYRGMTAEHIYTLIPVEEDDGGGGQGQGDGQGDDQNNDPGGDGGVNDSPESQNAGSTQSQQRAEESEWKTAVAQAAHVAKQAGNLPADLERMMEELFEPVLPWKDILRRFMTEKANDDFSWRRGNRRFIAQGLYLPSRESEGTGDIAIMIDTSCSVGQDELDAFGSEAIGVIRELRPTTTYVIYCDSRVQHVDEFGPDDDIQFKLHGGGGTDFRPPFEWLEERQIVPKCAVYLTDGHGPFPDEPDYPTMWCIDNYDVIPPIGEHLIIAK